MSAVLALAAARAAGDVAAPSSRWQTGDAGLAAARKAHRPAMLFFTADWCMPCKELERVTLADSRVARELERFVLIRVDCTDSDAPAAVAAMKRWNVQGLPVLIALDGAGKEQRRVTQFLSADELLAILNAAPLRARPPAESGKTIPTTPSRQR